MSKTTVVFRKWKSGPGKGGIIALFPLIDERAGRCLSYEHIGQHGIADYNDVIGMTDPAQPEEYVDLKMELEQIGYRLRIAKRNSGKVKLEE